MPDSGYWILDNFLKGNLRSAGGLTEFVLPSMLGSWPGGKGVARRKHRPGEPFSQGLRSISAERGEPVGDPPDRPYADSTRGLSTLLHKFGNVFSGQAASRVESGHGVFILEISRLRSLRVNFHSKGFAICS